MPAEPEGSQPFDPDVAQDRLDELGQKIDETRRNVEADVDPARADDEDTFVDSGATPDEDDQTIAPG